MDLPATTEELLAVLERNGWNTALFARPADAADWNRGDAPSAPVNELLPREAAVAYGRIRQYVRNTPLEPSPWLSGLAAGLASEAENKKGGVSSSSCHSDCSSKGRCCCGAAACGRCCQALLKLESEQHTGSFKVRGALNKLLSLPLDQLDAGVFTASTGNHALAVLYSCAALSAAGLPVSGSSASLSTKGKVDPVNRSSDAGTCGGVGQPLAGETKTAGASTDPVTGSAVTVPLQLYVPETASPYKISKLRALGGNLHLYGTDCLQAETAARSAAAASGGVYVSPYNDPWVMAGQGTVALELLAARRRGQLDVVLVPVGGGGLVAGVAAVLKAADPSIRVIGCQPAASDVMARSVAAGAVQPESDGDGDTLSDATAGGVEYDSLTLQPCTACVDEWVTVGEQEIAEALVGLLEEHSKLVEGAAGCALAAFKRLSPRLAGLSVVVVACGGNIALPTLRRAIDMARPGSS